LPLYFHGCRDIGTCDDLDLMLNPTEENGQRLLDCLLSLGLQAGWSAKDISRHNVQLPIKRDFYLDVITPPDDIEYQSMKQRSLAASLNNIFVQVVSREDLIALKRIAVRRQQGDVAKHQTDLRCLAAE
jgi:hypothetical protein